MVACVVRVTVRPCFQRFSRQNSNFPAIFFEFEISAICITLESVENFPPYSFIEENGGRMQGPTATCTVCRTLISNLHLSFVVSVSAIATVFMAAARRKWQGEQSTSNI